MATVKYQLIQEIEGIDNENLLKEILILLQDINGLKKYIHLTPEQKTQTEEARKEYLKTDFYETDQFFKQLLNE